MNQQSKSRAMSVAPHALAAQAGRDVLRDGGNAIEASVAIAATLAVVYPHMTGIGGDSFWLLSHPQHGVRSLCGAGRSPLELDAEQLRQAGLSSIPGRGPWAALTVAGTVKAWETALRISRESWNGRLPLARLLHSAIEFAEFGYPVTDSQAQTIAGKLQELRDQFGFREVFLRHGSAPDAGARQTQPALAQSLRRLALAGLDDFYHGELAQRIAADLAAAGSPITLRDLAGQHTETWAPLSLALPGLGRFYTTPPPTQGLATLCLLGQFARARRQFAGSLSADYVHFLAESTKQAFRIRDRLICDPQDMPGIDYAEMLSPQSLDALAIRIAADKAMPWRGAGDIADTTWFGVIDDQGRAVSCIQSLYHEFGSAIVLPESGICWQNRGAAFSLDADNPRVLKPGRLPFHTLCPSLVQFDDGRCMVLGSMGGDGQPQFQSCVFTRYACFNHSLAEAIMLPRWVLGRTWGQHSDTLKLEGRFSESVIAQLREYGHQLEIVADFDDIMGHAGALVRHPDGGIEGAADPRSDGSAEGY